MQSTVFPVVMYGCESWTVKKAEHRKIDAFELWCWRRLLRVPWTARRSSQSILKEISVFIGRADAEAETPILWPSHVIHVVAKSRTQLSNRTEQTDTGSSLPLRGFL